MISNKVEIKRLVYASLLCIAALSGCTKQSSVAPPTTTTAQKSPVHFTDISHIAGIDYQWPVPEKRPLTILQTIGNGCAFLDYDNDGNLDVLLVGPKLALFKGDGHGHFIDVTSACGLSKLTGHFLGCAVADYDGDGYPDIYISGYRTGVLLHNELGEKFHDVTAASGIMPQPWGTACTFVQNSADIRTMDLVVCNYAKFGPAPQFRQLCGTKGQMTSCGPRYYEAIRPVYYKNLGNGKFSDQTVASGFSAGSGRSLGIASAPLDPSMRPWVAIANDEKEGDLFQPTGNMAKNQFKNVATAAAVAADRDGNIHGGMGADWGDYDNDGKLDLFVSTYAKEAKSLYHNDGIGLFSDESYPTGIAAVTMPNVAFGCKFADLNNNGNLDLIIANGHVEDNVHDIDPTQNYKQLPQILYNSGGDSASFKDIGSAAGSAFAQPIVGRGLAIGDIDNDGRVDIVLVDSEGKAELLRNDTEAVGTYLGITLQGVKSNSMGIGSLVTVTSGGKKFTRLCHTDGSYLSASDSRVMFGLGSAKSVESIEVRWPSGVVDKIGHQNGNTFITVREGSGVVRPKHDTK